MQDLLTIVRIHVASRAVGASSARGAGRKGVVRVARRHFASMKLVRFGTSRKSTFQAALNATTASLLKVLPPKAKQWGLARKLVNMFLRDCLYNHYLRAAYGLDRAEAHFEVPLDSVTGKALRKLALAGKVPAWRGLVHLTESESELFQAFALAHARSLEVARIHLDALLWSDLAQENASEV